MFFFTYVEILSQIDGTKNRYVISGNGVLQIVSVYRNDSGTYVCVADNGAGQPIRKEFNLEVKGEFSDFFLHVVFLYSN